MPVQFKIYDQHDLVHVQYIGEVTADESLHAFREYLAKVGAKPCVANLVDVRQANDLKFSFTQLAGMASIKSSSIKREDQEVTFAFLGASTDFEDLFSVYLDLVPQEVRHLYGYHTREKSALDALGVSVASLNELTGMYA